MNRRAHPCCREPRWHNAAAFGAGPPDSLRHWLLDDGSLTRRLRKICNGGFRVEILHQGWAYPMVNESRSLKIKLHRRVFSREVLLYCGSRAMVYARTVIPAITLKGRLSRLAYLGNKPLGEILFTDPRIQRGNLEIARVRSGELLFEKALQAALGAQSSGIDAVDAIWARRSAFLYHDKRLLVSEIFLPNPEFGYGKADF
jgi:chorismate--pyruvate lyase